MMYSREEWEECYPGQPYPDDTDNSVPELLPPPIIKED